MPNKRERRQGLPRNTKGSALLLTLSSLVLLSLLVLVFLVSARNERLSSALYTRGEEVRLWRDTVVNLVISQIREGTSQPDKAWISQPGAIRTFSGTNIRDQVYKLYSARELVVPGDNFDPASLDDIPQGGGALNSQVFTDLNAPVKSNGKWFYPIVDAGLLTNLAIEGFSVDTAQVASVDKNSIAGTPPQIPMPVRWLYLMESGALATVNDAGEVQDDFVKPDGSADKIVARVAFWTDDETCKLNINTASSGLYWDTPIGRGNDFERGTFAAGGQSSYPVVTLSGLAASPPATREFQRYPGHPATTSLDVVFNNSIFFDSAVPTRDRVLKMLELSPRNQWGGSEHGAKFPVSTQPGGKVSLDGDRLYATVDELFYKDPAPSEIQRPTTAATGSATPSAPAMNLTADTLSLARFFLTANSRAPEVTAFNTPRVTIWPVDTDPANRTLFDKTIAFCSTIAGREYIFKRSAFDPDSISMASNGSFTGAASNGSQSATKDFTGNNQDIYRYLQRLMNENVPGFGASLSTKFGIDSDQVLTQIYDYIRSTNLFDCSDPNAKPFTGRPFFWNEAVRLGEHTSNLGATIKAGLPLPRDPGSHWNMALQYYIPSAFAGQVVPAEVGNTRGFGRFPTVVGATIGFFATDTNPRKTDTDLAAYTPIQLPSAADRTRQGWSTWAPASEPAGFIRGMLVLSLVNPSAGPLAHTHTYDIRINGLDTFRVNSASANFPTTAINRVLGLPFTTMEGTGMPYWDPLFTGPAIDTASVSSRRYGFNTRRNALSPATGNNAFAYPFASQDDIAVSGNTLSFTGGLLEIEILVGGTVVQTVNMQVPDFSAPMPRWSPVEIAPGRWIDGRQGPSASLPRRWDNRIGFAPENSPITHIASSPVNFIFQIRPVFMPNNLDTIRSVEMNTSAAPFGDARLVAGLKTVPTNYFQPCEGYSDATRSQATSLWGLPQSVNGKLALGVNTASETAASQLFGLPSTLNGARRSDGGAGDWDLGASRRNVFSQGFTESGAFINKPNDSASSFRDNNGNIALPHFKTNASIVSLDNAFSPNRMIPSAVMFGSLPVGVKRGLPWQTLLFRPNTPSHPGAANPPDHLILDLFHMPVVEPYAISEPFSTAGKVNLNWQIAPFSYIKRSTAMRGVLYPERITAIPTTNAHMFSLRPNGSDGGDYEFATAAVKAINYRYPINRNATMALFEERFTNNQPFLTASQICEIPLVPQPENKPTASGLEPASVTPFQTALSANATASQVRSYVDTFWNNTTEGGAGTADNLRERPYTTIYPRVTTKSNTFQIHMKIQGIQKSPTTAPNKIELGDGIISEYQGSAIVERFLDPDPSKISFDPNDSNSSLGPYKFRVVSTKQFNP